MQNEPYHHELLQPHCHCVEYAPIGPRGGWIWCLCTELHWHEGKHFDYKRNHSWPNEGYPLWWDMLDFNDASTKPRKRVKKSKSSKIRSTEARGNLSMEKSYETRTGQKTFAGEKRKESDSQKDVDDIDAVFQAIADELYEEYNGLF